jgi:hypothetical protein
VPTPERREREDERAFLHRVRKLLRGNTNPIAALTDGIVAPSRGLNRTFRRLLEVFPSKETLTEDLLAEIEVRLEELEPGLKPLPELREREWDEVFMDLQHRLDTEAWSYDTLIRRWLDKQGLPQQHRDTVKIRYARWRKEHRPLDGT